MTNLVNAAESGTADEIRATPESNQETPTVRYRILFTETQMTATAVPAAAQLITELRYEAEKTRTILARVPEDRLDWRPHPKSMSLGQLTLHIARLPLGIAKLAEERIVEVPTVPLTEATSGAQLLETLDHGVEYAAARLAEWGEEGLSAEWALTAGGEPIMRMPRGDLLRALMFNHVYHHRGQLTVYLRLLGVPVPPMYGPTADENPLV
jgi:uncharacterized damage-inducible protein DinB